ncbi:MAG: DUF1080 domain-containing protein [Anaerolineales bacterium]|nr:DUF1080 domain-containing protein [Anaerolineales bacterium]
MKNHISTLFAFIALLLVMSLACSVFSGTQTSPDTEASQQPDQPRITKPPVQPTEPPVGPTEPPVPPSSEAPDYFTEEFDGNVDNWSQKVELNADSGKKSEAKITVDNGFLAFDMGKYLIGYVFYKPYNYKNVRLDIRVDNRGTNENHIMLVCRKSDEGHYLVDIANNGLFKIRAFDGAKGNYAKLADGGSKKIKVGKEINEYALVCSDKTLTLYINGVETRSYTDNQYVFRKGQVGVGVASEDQLPVKVNFDWVKISQP